MSEPDTSPAAKTDPPRGRLLWRAFPEVRRNERQRFRFFAALAALITLAQTIGLAGSDALFLAGPGPEALPTAFILASVVSVTGSLAYAFAVGRFQNDALFVALLSGSGVVLLGGVALAASGVEWVLTGFFVAAYVTQGVLLYLHYWTFATDYFDTLSSKRIFPYLVISGSLGGIGGGGLGFALTAVAPTETLIVTWALALLCAAVLVQRSRASLRRWFPVGHEADESSAEGMSAALRFIRRSPLARWLTVSVVGMVLALFLMQFLEMRIFTEAFESPEELARFFAIYLGVTNGIEILVARVVTPALLSRFGIATANLLHPALTLLAFGALAFDPRLHIAILARANRELMDNALASTIRSLSYNALPFRFRGRMRAFLEGMVYYAAMSAAGGALLLVGDRLDHRALCAVGGGAALIYGLANFRVRGEYLRSLVDELRSGRLDLEAVSGDLGDLELTRLADQWRASLADDLDPPRGWLDLPPLFARNGLTEPLFESASHPNAAVRLSCLEALAGTSDPGLPELLETALRDPEPPVRLAAARAAAELGELPEALGAPLRSCLNDPDPRVRAEVAVVLPEEGLPTLAEMASTGDPAAAIEALRRLPPALLDQARSRLDDEDADVRATALGAARRLSDWVALSPERLERDLEHPDAGVRLAAAEALGAHQSESAATLLAVALDDPSRPVRAAAASGLAAMGDLGVRAAEDVVESIRRWTADAALQAVARARTPSARAVLERAFRTRVREAWENVAALQFVPAGDDVAFRFLETALEDARSRSTGIAFRVLELIEDPQVVRSVRKALEVEGERRRADALEVLSNLGDREYAHRLALLLEEGPVEEKLGAVRDVLQLPRRFDEVVERARNSPDRFIKLAVAPEPGASGPPASEVNTMESLLALRRVPLFAQLTLEQLEAIGKFMKEAQYIAGEVVVREGELGEELYVILEGEARAFKNYGTADETPLTTMSPAGVGYFGEIAIFDRAPRSATVVITRDARLLTLGGERFMDLILQTPGISFEIFKVLTQRLRNAEERLRAQEDEERSESS